MINPINDGLVVLGSYKKLIKNLRLKTYEKILIKPVNDTFQYREESDKS